MYTENFTTRMELLLLSFISNIKQWNPIKNFAIKVFRFNIGAAQMGILQMKKKVEY